MHAAPVGKKLHLFEEKFFEYPIRAEMVVQKFKFISHGRRKSLTVGSSTRLYAVYVLRFSFLDVGNASV
ncbi:hypothetical protein ZHAS_00019655 [Anopheles sinensis]|uniref:Uncharacterized protein n=1 Tax=Anopheles sinensis TaxID=74873 RepID=A0A084WMZ0_ANOSI|nr:hypothetical protein ZHAS_00019655 [Anopheles sinensis]